jgi:bifunctional polynucleotide phosphatase/kinase
MKRKSSQKSSENPLSKPSKRSRDEVKDESEDSWHEIGGMMYSNFSSAPSDKVLGFDMDSTLIATKSGKTFPVNDQDWKILYPNIPETLQKHANDGYRIVIFTNQKGIKEGKQDKNGMKNKIKSLLSELGVHALAMVSCGDDEYRKPCTGMWDYFVNNLNNGIGINLTLSKYIGDAAGRPATKSRKKDFNDTDLKYALNIGIPFETPEKFFLGEKDELPEPELNPKKIKSSGSVLKGEPDNSNIAKDHTEVIIFIGSPGSGKSTFWKNYLSAYTRVNNDTLKSKDKCLKVMRASLASNKSCVIDNTNPKAETRADYIKLAREFNVPVRCFVFKIPKEMAFHLDTLRKVNKHRNHLSGRVGSMPIHKFYKDFQEPTPAEGISEIREVELVGGPFENPEDEKLFYSYVYA